MSQNVPLALVEGLRRLLPLGVLVPLSQGEPSTRLPLSQEGPSTRLPLPHWVELAPDSHARGVRLKGYLK